MVIPILFTIPLTIAEKPLLRFFLEGQNSSFEIEKILAITKCTFPIMALGQIVDSIRNMEMSILRSGYDSWVPTIVSFTSLIPIFLPLSLLFRVYFDMGIIGMTAMLPICLSLAVSIIMPRYIQYVEDPEKFLENRKGQTAKLTNCCYSLFKKTFEKKSLIEEVNSSYVTEKSALKIEIREDANNVSNQSGINYGSI